LEYCGLSVAVEANKEGRLFLGTRPKKITAMSGSLDDMLADI